MKKSPVIRKLVTLSPDTMAEVARRAAGDGIEDQRFGGPVRSESEALKRLIILGLEHKEAGHG